MKRYEEAIPYLQEAMSVYPRHRDIPEMSVYHQLAEAYIKIGRKKEALEVMMSLIKIDLADEPAAEKALTLAEELKDSDAVQTAAMQGIYINPYEIKFHQVAADTNFQKADYSQALRESLIAASIDKLSVEAWEVAAQSALKIGDKETASSAAREALKIRPTSEIAPICLERIEIKP